MSFELRRREAEKGPDEEEFNKLAHSVDDFTSSLLNPLKFNTESRRIFSDSLDNVMETAIELQQKKVRDFKIQGKLTILLSNSPGNSICAAILQIIALILP